MDLDDQLDREELLDRLTPKQGEVLNLLLKHKTTKQIARELSISRWTVDQRIAAVREKWGTADRKETARVYAQLLETYAKPAYDSSQVDGLTVDAPRAASDLPQSAVFHLSDVLIDRDFAAWSGECGGPEALDARFGKLWRIIAIPMIAVLIGMVLIWGLAFADQLGGLL